MKHLLCVTLVLLSVIAISFAQEAERPSAKHRAFLSLLHVGQRVSLNESLGGYEIGMFESGNPPMIYKVTEIGQDYMVFQDWNEISTIHVPIYAIRAIKVTRIPK